MVGRLDGKVAIVSGAARGQGRAEARRFVAEGAGVVMGDVLDDEGAAAAAELGDRACYVHLDVRAPEQWAHAVAAAEQRYGPVDVLVNNAAIRKDSKLTHEIPIDEYREVIEVNQIGVLLGMQAVLPGMLKLRRGSIVNVSSVGGLRGHGGSIAYGSSKWAVRGMTKVAALEYGAAGIRVNSIHPGPIDTLMINPTHIEGEHDTELGGQYRHLATPRSGSVDEVANLVLFLASDESSYCNGAEFVIDGGLTAGGVSLRAE